MNYQVCTQCNMRRPEIAYKSRLSKGKIVLRQPCSNCRESPRDPRKRWHVKYSRYGITEQQFWNLWDAQYGCCAICEYEFNKIEEANVDHNHETKKIRGLLCGHCNKGLGQFKDNPNLLDRALLYILENR